MTNPTYTDEQVLRIAEILISRGDGQRNFDPHGDWRTTDLASDMLRDMVAYRQRLQAEVIDVILLMKECALYLECNDPKAPPLSRVHDFLVARATPNETKEAKS